MSESAPNIDDPKDGNKVVSPENTHTNPGVGGVGTNGNPVQVNKVDSQPGE